MREIESERVVLERYRNNQTKTKPRAPLLSQPDSGFCATRHTFSPQWCKLAVPQPSSLRVQGSGLKYGSNLSSNFQ